MPPEGTGEEATRGEPEVAEVAAGECDAGVAEIGEAGLGVLPTAVGAAGLGVVLLGEAVDPVDGLGVAVATGVANVPVVGELVGDAESPGEDCGEDTEGAEGCEMPGHLPQVIWQ